MANQIIAPFIPIINEDGSVNINQENYLQAFRAENWSRLNPNARIRALQCVENRAADEQGRLPREVQYATFLDDKDGGSAKRKRGFYNPEEPDYLTLNTTLIESDNPFQAVATTFHEGRHAYQHDVVTGRTLPEKNQDPIDAQIARENKKVWGENFLPNSHFSLKHGHTFSEYRYQSIEADANNYSDKKMNDLGLIFGNDLNYKEWNCKRQVENEGALIEAKRDLKCDNPEEHMKNRVLGINHELDNHNESRSEAEKILNFRTALELRMIPNLVMEIN